LLDHHQFLVLERDNRTLVPTPPGASNAPNNKRIYMIDLGKPGLTDVSGMTDPLPLALGSIVPVDKVLIVDMLKAGYKVDATHTIKDVIAEKIEGLAWGPDLPDGRHVLYVISDNDLFVGPPARPTQIFAFAIDSSAQGANFTYQPQLLPGPLYPPGQLKKQVQ
jgi:phytase-like protein